MRLKLCILFLFWALSADAQRYLYLENEMSQAVEAAYSAEHDFSFHSAVRPYFISDSIKAMVDPEGIFDFYIEQESENASLAFLPLVSTVGGIEFSDVTRGLINGGIGLGIEAQVKNKFFLNASGFYAGGNYERYRENFMDRHNVVPGMGQRLSSDLIRNNYFRFDLLIAYRPYEFLALEAGVGKQFIGEGYRSFFVSDWTSTNPFARLNLNVWRLNFSATYSHMTHLQPMTGPDWPTAGKFSARHYLSWNATKWLRVGFFESVVWQSQDGDNFRGFDPHYLNPIQFYRPVEFAIGSADNSLLGFDLCFKIQNKYMIYTQLMLDEFLLREIREANGWWANKYAMQFGVKSFDPFGMKKSFLRLEFNLARPFTFSHGSNKQNYAHMGQAIAHPLEANFYEGLAEFNIHLGDDAYLENFIMYYLKGDDPVDENLGGDIFKSYTNPSKEYGNYIGQGLQRKVFMYQLQYSYLISDRNRLKAIAGMRIRHEDFEGLSRTDLHVYFGISTRIWNDYTTY